MNAVAKSENVNLLTADKSEIVNQINGAVTAVTKGEKGLVFLLAAVCERYYSKDSASADVINNLVGALSELPSMQYDAMTLIKRFTPVEFKEETDAKNVTAFKAVNKYKAFKDVPAETVAKMKADLELFKAKAYRSLSAAVKDKGSVKTKDGFFKPVDLKKSADKMQSVALGLLAQMLLSEPDLDLSDAKEKLVSAIDGLADVEINKAKEAILAKTPLKPVEEKKAA